MNSGKINKNNNFHIRNELKSQTDSFLRITLLIMSIIFFLLLLVNLIFKFTDFKATNWIYGSLMIIGILLLIAVKYGYSLFSSISLIIISWSAMLFFTWNGRGLYDAANLATLVIILFAAILINRKFALIVATFTLINYWLVLLYTIKYHPNIHLALPLNMGRDFTAIMFATIALIFIYEKNISKTVLQLTELLFQREKDQLKIKETEKSYYEIFESIDDAIFILDADDGTIIDFNLSACAMFGYQKSELALLDINSLSAVELGYTGKLAMEKIKLAEKTGHFYFEWKSKRANNSVFWSDVHIKKSFLNGENRILAVIRDISYQKEANEQLRNSEEKYRTLVLNIPGAIYRCETENPWKTIYISDEIENISGYKAENFIANKILFGDIMQTSDKLKVNEIVENAIKNKHEFELEYRILHKDGSIRWIFEKGRAIYNDKGFPKWLDGVMYDITDNKNIEDEHKKISVLQSAILENAGYAIIATDTKGLIHTFNKAAEKMLGYSADEIIGIHNPAKFHDSNEITEQAKMLSAKLGQNIEPGFEAFIAEARNGISIEYEWTYIRKDGSRLPILLKISSLYDNLGNIMGFLGLAVDITERKIAEKTIKENSEKFKIAFENAPTGMSMINPEGKFIAVNPKLCEILGYTSEELLSGEINNITHPDDIERGNQWIKKMISGDNSEPEFEKRYIHKDGHIVWAMIRSQWIYDINGKNLLSVSHILDITERKKVEKTLTDERNLLRALLDTLHTIVYIKDLESKFVIVNKQLTAHLGHSVKDIIGKTDFDFYNKDKANEFYTDEQNLIKTRTAIIDKIESMQDYNGNETVLMTSKLPLIDSDGNIIGLVGSGLNITDRIKAEKALINERNLLRTLIDTLPNLVFIKDMQSRFVLANEPLANLMEVEIHDLIGRNDFDFYPKDRAMEFLKEEQTLFIKGTPVIGKIEKYKNKNGEDKIIIISKTPIINSEGIISGLVGSGLDITEMVKAEEEIKILNSSLETKVNERTRQLQQANKDLESFAYSVSHDLRSPIRHVDGFIKLLYSNIESPNELIKEYYKKIETSSKRMSTMIDDLLSFSRLGRREINFNTVDINQIIKEIIDQLNIDFNIRNIKWKINKLPLVQADKGLIRIVFENLISNAIKYTSKKSVAEIEIGANDIENNQTEIYIKDNGAGFDIAYVNKLFGVFQRLHTNEEFEGTGIGLASVKQIISKHNGVIRAIGAIDEGATFYFTLVKT